MRLTAELINSSLTYFNSLNERELDLRGHQIPTIENLGAVKDHESIDFTDNHIATLSNFPLSPRLQTLLCARNRISTIQTSFSKNLPNLKTLVLTHNNITELAALDPLQGCGKLTYVSLVDNPVTGKENYRYYILWRCPQIRFLDFVKVKDAERAKGKELFGTFEAPTELAQSIMAALATDIHAPRAGPSVNGANKRIKLPESEQKLFEASVRKAKTLAEIQKLEKAANERRFATQFADGEEHMDET